MMQLSLVFTELMGNIKSKSSKQHTISNKNDAIIAVTGYIRSAINDIFKYHSTYSLFNLLEINNINITSSSLTSYDSVPICIINLIIKFYYLNENETENKMDEPPLTLSSLKVGGKIDAKDDWEKYYPATILYIKQQNNEFPINNNIQRLSVSPGIKYLYPNDWNHDLGLFIHYNGCSSRYDEWIFVKKHTICDCNDLCHYKDLHFIAKHNTQSNKIGLTQQPHFGIPSIKKTVGLANLGNTSWLNAILQCLYHTKEFKAFIINAKYIQNDNNNNNNNNNKKQYNQFIKNNQLLFKLHDVFSNLKCNEFNVVSPINIKRAIFNDMDPPQFDETGDKPLIFLKWILNKISKNNNIINNIFEGRYQIQYKKQEINDMNDDSINNMDRNRNKNKNKNNNKMSRWFGRIGGDQMDINIMNKYKSLPSEHSTFLLLSLPIINGMQRDFIIDVYDSRNNEDNKYKKNKNGINPPHRHRVTLPRNGKVSDLESLINKMYNVNSDHESTFFYRLWGFRCCYVWNSFEPLTDVDDNIACYIIKDWSPSNHICHVHHVRPIKKPELNQIINNDDNDENESSQTIPHDNYCLDIDTDDETDDDEESEESQNIEIDDNIPTHHYTQHRHQEVHMNDKHVIHPYAFGMPFIVSLPNNNTTGRLVHKIIYERLYGWIGDDNILRRPPPILRTDDINDINEDIETEWDLIFVDLPYTLRWVHKDYNFYFDGYKPPIVTADDVRINYTWNYHANIVVEWNQDKYEIVKPLFNKIENTDKNNKCVHDPDTMNIYQCIDEYMRSKVVEYDDNDNDDFNNKQLKMWALPEVLILHLPRFYQFTIERLNKTVIRSGYIPSLVEYPIYNLDLSGYMAEELTMNAKYDLYSVCCHSGTNHFYTFNKQNHCKWYKFEDNKVTKIDESSLVNNKALILFYKKTKQNKRLANHSLFNQYF